MEELVDGVGCIRRLAKWDDRVAMLQKHLEEKIEAIKKLNKMACTFTGKDTLALNTYEQVRADGEICCNELDCGIGSVATFTASRFGDVSSLSIVYVAHIDE